MGGDPAVEGGDAVAALHAPAERLRVEAGGEMVAGKGEAVSRHPVIGEGERGGEIARPPLRRAVEAGLERIALAAAQSLRQVPIGTRAGPRAADDGARSQAIVEP